jgi:hypothetical protein
MLKDGNHAGSGKGYVLLHCFAFFADYVSDAITSMSKHFHAETNAYKGQDAGDNCAGRLIFHISTLVHDACENTHSFDDFEWHSAASIKHSRSA